MDRMETRESFPEPIRAYQNRLKLGDSACHSLRPNYFSCLAAVCSRLVANCPNRAYCAGSNISVDSFPLSETGVKKRMAQ